MIGDSIKTGLKLAHGIRHLFVALSEIGRDQSHAIGDFRGLVLPRP